MSGATGPGEHWVEWRPKAGWSEFVQTQALVDAIWEGLSEHGGQWHYMNLTSQSSIWESMRDGSAIEMGFEAGGGAARLQELRVSAGDAAVHMAPIVTRFGLCATKASFG